MSFTGLMLLMLAMHHAHGGAPSAAMHELFPGVRADTTAKVVEFDAKITPMLVKDERAPIFYLEVIACAPNTREHETFLVTTARPSHIHAALLAIGLNPGSPGTWSMKDGKLTSAAASGDRLSVRIAYTDKDGREVEVDPLDWIVSEKGKVPFVAAETKTAAKRNEATPGWIFAGSKIVKRRNPEGEDREVYDADGSGTIIGLTTFGSEVIAWSRVISPDASVEEPEWIADFSKTPPADTTVRVRVRKADDR